MSNSFFDWSTSPNRLVRFDTARAEDINAALDSASSGFDGVEIKTNAAIKLPDGETAVAIGAVAARANKVLSFDASGNPETSVTVTEVSNAQGYATSAAADAASASASALSASGSASAAAASAASINLPAFSGNSLKGLRANSGATAWEFFDPVYLSNQNSWTKPQRPSLSSETAPSSNTVTWDLTTDQILRINLNANITTFNLTGTLSSLAGNQYQVIVRYNGGSTITWNANIKWPAGTAPTLTGTSGKVDTFTFVVSSTDGTNFYLLNTGKTQNL